MQKLTYLLALLSVLNGIPLKAQIDTDRMTIIGRNALYFEDYILAIQYFNQVIRAKPYLSEPYYFRGIGKYNLDDLKGAEQDVSKALELNPYYVDAYNLRGIIRQKLGKNREAISDFSRGLEIDPGNINLVANTGIAQINNKEYEKAVETYSKVISLSPNLVSAWLNRGHAKVAAQDTIGGMEDFTKAISLNPYIPDGYSNRAIVYYMQNEYDKALEDLDKALELRPDDPRLYMNRGIVRYQQDNLRGTVEDFDKVIELEPRNAMAYSNRGILRAQIGDVNRAIEDFSRVLALRNDDLLTLYYRALLLAEIGEYRRALADFNIVADNFPDFAQVYFNRSQVKQKLGDNRGAELDYGTAVKLELARREKSDKPDEAADLAAVSNKKNQEGTKQQSGERKATRKESDTDISNYDKVAVLDDFGAEQPEEMGSNPLRGRIQNRNIVIDMEQVFGLTFYPGDTLVHRLRYFNMEVDAFNRKAIIGRTLKIANQEQELDRQDAAYVFEKINTLSESIKPGSNPDNEPLLLARGTLFNTVANLNNALDDFNRIIDLKPDNYLAYFNRAYTRYKMVEMMRAVEAEIPDSQESLRIGAIGARQTQTAQGTERRILDFDLIINDLEKVIELNPQFTFAHFNLGMIQAIQRNFDAALEHFSKSIEINPDFAEAWFNRGLTRIFLEQETEGTLDLSKAGELGIFKAYNVIKRYGAGTADTYEEDKEE
jgi:tetratricopeptide (TPR) repeat protein